MDYQEVLRRWLAGNGVRSIAKGAGLDRKTLHRLVKIARELGLKPGDPWPDDQAISMFTGSVRRPGPAAHVRDLWISGSRIGAKGLEIRCGKCHPMGGRGDKTNSLTGLTREDYRNVLENAADLGVGMPAFTGGAIEREALIDYFMTLRAGGGK